MLKENKHDSTEITKWTTGRLFEHGLARDGPVLGLRLIVEVRVLLEKICLNVAFSLCQFVR